jgi:hypothetical protein
MNPARYNIFVYFQADRLVVGCEFSIEESNLNIQDMKYTFIV